MVPRPHTGRFDGRARQQTNGAGAAHYGRIGRNNAGAVVLGYVYATVHASANAPTREKKEPFSADANANADAFAIARANAPEREKKEPFIATANAAAVARAIADATAPQGVTPS